MRYEFKIRYNNKEITAKGPKYYQGTWDLNEFVKLLRISTNASYHTIHMMTDISPNRLKSMENGDIEITKDDFNALRKVFKFPRKTINLFNDKDRPIWAVRLAELRSTYNYTQKQISDALGIAQTTYAGYETGKHEPDFKIITKLADIYKVSIDYIMGRY